MVRVMNQEIIQHSIQFNASKIHGMVKQGSYLKRISNLEDDLQIQKAQ